ncbi:MAG: type II toxin-antitoxin system prevent-host-death family antitoxin [Terriglobales bacterium]
MARRISASKARDAFSDLVSRAAYGGERVVVHRRKKPVAAVVPIEDLELLERLEDKQDIRAARASMREKGPSIPWSKIKKELGL